MIVLISGANVHDSQMFAALIDGIPNIYNGKMGPPRFRPRKVLADKGYDYPFCRRFLRQRNIKARIARRGIESKERLGRYRWVVERTLAWLWPAPLE